MHNSFKNFVETSEFGINSIVDKLRTQYPGLALWVFERPTNLHLQEIRLPINMRSQGIGSIIIKSLQEYARSVNKPIVLSPEPERGMKKKLLDFYKLHGFKPNKGKYMDYTLSSPTAPTMVWRP
jgi:hypothetical protein